MSSILLEGENTLTLLGDEGKHFWLITESPCLQVAQPEPARVKSEPARVVIAEHTTGESAPITKPAPVASDEPAPVVTPAPADATDPTNIQRVVFFVLTLMIIFAKIVQVGWIVGALLLTLAGLVAAFRYRSRIQAWIVQQIHTIRKEAV